MHKTLSPAEIERLRRESKKVSRAEEITYTEALDRAAALRGYQNWAVMHALMSGTPRRFPVFTRTAEEMRQAFRKDARLDGMRGNESALRETMPDYSTQFANPMSALLFARDYLDLALSLPRYNPNPLSIAAVEMRVLLPYEFEPLGDGKDNRFIIVGRDYKPLGMTSRRDHVDYEQYKNLHVKVPTEDLHRITRHWEYTPGYLYGHSPRSSRKHATALMRQLDSVIELVAKHE